MKMHVRWRQRLFDTERGVSRACWCAIHCQDTPISHISTNVQEIIPLQNTISIYLFFKNVNLLEQFQIYLSWKCHIRNLIVIQNWDKSFRRILSLKTACIFYFILIQCLSIFHWLTMQVDFLFLKERFFL